MQHTNSALTAVPAAAAVACGLVVFLVPGLVLLALVPPRERAALALDEALFLAVGTSVMLSAWVALVLAEAGRFSLYAATAVLIALSAAAVVLGRRRLSPGWPRQPSSPWAVAAVLAIAVSLQARPGEYIVGGRDPGTYVATMAVIARTGGIVYTDPGVLSIPREDVELFYRHPDGPAFSWGRFMGFPLERPETGRVVPEFFHLFPAFGAYLFRAAGVKGALATPAVFGVLGTVGAYLAFRRLFGPATGLLAALLLASNVVQVWFARYPVSESLSQFLVFVALLAFALWEETGSAALAALAGAAIGLSLLVRIDGVLILAPVVVWTIVRRGRGERTWRELAPLWLPIALLAGHAGLHGAFWSRKYVLDILERPYWRQSGTTYLAAAAGLLALAAAGPVLVAPVAAFARRNARFVRVAVPAAVVLLALYAYFLRPQLSAWAGAAGNDPSRALAHAGPLRALGFHRLAAHDAQSFLRLGWFLTPAVLALAVAGFTLLVRDWRPRYLFPILTAATVALFYFYKIRIYNDYFFALRRFVPVVVPFMLALAALALVRAARGGGPRRVAAGAVALAVLAAYWRQTWPLLTYRDWKNSVRFVADVARRFGPDDVVIFEQRESVHLLSLPLWAVHGVNVLELARWNPDPDRLRHLVGAWRGRYRNIYFVHTWRTRLCELFLQHVEDYAFGTFEWERAYGRPPAGPEFRALRFTVSRVVPPEELRVPPLPEVDIGGSDDFQVSGFYDKEGFGERTYRWTGACGSVYLPGASGGARLVVTAGTGRRPPDPPAVVRASLAGAPLGTFTATSDWGDYTLPLPGVLPSGPPVLRLEVRAWRPANVDPASSDVRDLGVMVDRVRLETGPRDKVTVSSGGGASRQ
ncbi:MAG TPA: glycosyltransferase family 39 protein [Vicinamibacteria bacterium]|nr:glycosyltransferase family 39 protein [Vicinamibacteria bacterium]